MYHLDKNIERKTKELRSLTNQFVTQERAKMQPLRGESRRITEAALVQLDSDVRAIPRLLGRATEMQWTPDRRPILSSRTVIALWDDGHGNAVYTLGVPDRSQVRELSGQISAQETAFSQLTEDQQIRLRNDFESSGESTRSVEPYQAFLESEFLKRRYQKAQETTHAVPRQRRR